MERGFGRVAGVAAIWFAVACTAFAQTPQPGSRFDITGYVVEGSPLLKSEDFSRIVAPFIGKQKSAADVQQAQQTLQQAYFDLGHCSVQVTVPKTNPDAGVITFRLVQTPAPLSKDCLPMAVLAETRAAPPVTVRPGEVAVRPFADVSETAPETPPAASRPEIAHLSAKPLQDRPMIKPLQDRPAGTAPAPKPEIAAAPVPREETAADVTVKPLAEVPSPQPGLVASTDISAPPPAARPPAVPDVPVAPPAVVAVAPPMPQLELKPEIALAPAPPPTPKTETLPVAPAPKVEAAPAPPPVVSEPVKPKPEPAPVAPAPVVAPAPTPKIEVPPVAVAITPPAVAEALKPAETPAAPAIAAPAEPIVVPKPVAPSVAVAVAPPVAPAPKVEAAPVPPPIVSELVKPKPEPATVAPAPVVAPVEAAPSPAPKVEVPPVAVAITPPAVTEAPKPAETPAASLIAAPTAIPEPVAQIELPKSAPAVEMPKLAAIEEKPAPPSEMKPAAEPVKEQIVAKPEPVAPIKVEPMSAPEVVKAPPAEKPAEKPAPAVVALTPITPEPIRAEPEAVPVVPAPEPELAPALTPALPPVVASAPKLETVSPAKPAPVIQAPRIAITEEKPVTPLAPKPAVAAVPAAEQIAAQAESKPAPQPAPSVPAITAESKPELPLAVAAAPASAPKVEAKPAERPGLGATPVAPADVTVRQFTDAAATVAEAPEPAETKPEITRAPVRPLQDRPQAPSPPAEKPAIAMVAAPAAESKPATAAPAKPAAAKPEPAPPVRIAEAAPGTLAPAAQKPRPKPAPVVVHAPAGSAQSAPLGIATQTTTPDGAPAVAAPLKFVIERFLVEGNTVLKPAIISSVLSRYTGPQKDFGDVQRALEALQTAYQNAGYGAVQVTLPEQELDDGEVELNVIETRLGKIDVQGNDYHNEQNIRNSLPEVKEGTTPNSLAIARNLRIANENSSKQTQVALRAGSEEGEVDVTVKVVDDSPIKRSVSMDNTGTYATGKYRIGFGYQNANMFNRDHTLTLQYITSPEHPSAVTVLGLGYRVPLYKLGHSIDVIAGYSDVQSGTVQQLFNVSGAGTVFGARYNQNLDRSENYEHKIVYGLDYRAFKSNVTFVGSLAQLVPDITVHPVSITYSGLWRAADSQFDFYASYAQNIFPGGNDGANSDFQGPSARFPTGSRALAKAGYNVIRAGANYTRQIWGEWQARAVVATQYTDSALIAGEQFGVGGADSVRGFDERAFSNDRGYRGTLELYTPDMASNFGWSGGRIKFLVFYDTANLTRNARQPGELDGLSLDSRGVGLRLQTKNYLSVRADYAQVMHDGGQTAGMVNGRSNSNTLHASMVLVF